MKNRQKFHNQKLSHQKTNRQKIAKPYLYFTFAVVSILIIIAISIIGIFINSTKTATLEITVAPASADIKINGKSYHNGTYHLEPGTYSVKISKEDFETYEDEIELRAEETTELKKYLLEKNGGIDWYLNHSNDMVIMDSIGDSEAETESNNYANQDPIFTKTPYYDEEDNHFSISATQPTDREKIPVTIHINACIEPLISDYVLEAKNYLKDQGITLENYNLEIKTLCYKEAE